jgi:hypothetical protein
VWKDECVHSYILITSIHCLILTIWFINN